MEVQERAKLWEDWSRNFLVSSPRPMSDTLSHVFMTTVMLELANDPAKTEEMVAVVRDTFPYKVLNKRSEFVGLALSEPAKVFLCCLSDSPGTLVMYVYALRYWQLSNGDKELTVNTLATVFPTGFLTDQSLSDLWDDQKVELEDRTINLLDTLSKDNLQLSAV